MKRMLSLAICAIVALNGIGAITTVDVASGETYALTADSSGNNKDNVKIVAAGGSTITIPGGSGNYAFYPQLVVSGGVVRVEVASGATHAWCRFVSGLRSVEGGSLVMAAAPVVTVDRQNWSGIDTISARGPVCDISDVTFDSSVATSSSHFRRRNSRIFYSLKNLLCCIRLIKCSSFRNSADKSKRTAIIGFRINRCAKFRIVPLLRSACHNTDKLIWVLVKRRTYMLVVVRRQKIRIVRLQKRMCVKNLNATSVRKPSPSHIIARL